MYHLIFQWHLGTLCTMYLNLILPIAKFTCNTACLPFSCFLQGLLEVERRCPTCSERLKSLFQNQCLDSAHSKDCGTLLLYHNSSNNSFEAHRQLPRNRRKMKSKSNKFCFKHTEDECRYGGSCTFPHSKQEEEVWNLLLYSTQVTPCSELPEKANEVSLSKVSWL